jgi:hypothetical protein
MELESLPGRLSKLSLMAAKNCDIIANVNSTQLVADALKDHAH